MSQRFREGEIGSVAGARQDGSLTDPDSPGEVPWLLGRSPAAASTGGMARINDDVLEHGGPEPIWSGPIPSYLYDNYWWAYVHPRAVRFWERQWLVNLVLFGNLVKLRDAALDELGQEIAGRTLQIACVYGDFSVRLAERIAPGSTLDVIDVLPIQLRNLRRKLPESAPVTLHHQDSTALGFSDGIFDQVVIFFLLHEQPNAVRGQTLRETLRVVKPGGKVVGVDYHRPGPWYPPRFLLFEPVLRVLEPFAADLWYRDIREWPPEDAIPKEIRKQTFYSGLYQKLALTL